MACLRDGDYHMIRSDEIQVGNTLLIKEGEVFPCDIILLASSNQGICYI